MNCRTIYLIFLFAAVVNFLPPAFSVEAVAEDSPNVKRGPKYLEKLDLLIDHIPLQKDKIEALLNIDLEDTISSSNRYFTIYKTSSKAYSKIEVRLKKTEPKGLIILGPRQALKFVEIKKRYGDSYSLRVNAPQNPNRATYVYKSPKYTLSFTSNKENINEISVIAIDWIDQPT
jgi:hypothetical protein